MPQPKLLDLYRERLRVKHYSLRTEGAYLHWTRRFIFFHGKRHPRDMGGPEIEAFLSHLATEGRVAASTQTQALAALLFPYREVLAKELPRMDGTVRAKRPARVPVVLAENEVRALLAPLGGLPSVRARAQVSPRGPQLGLAVRLSRRQPLDRPARRCRRLRHPDCAGVARAQGRVDHDDLYAFLNKGGRGVTSPLDRIERALSP